MHHGKNRGKAKNTQIEGKQGKGKTVGGKFTNLEQIFRNGGHTIKGRQNKKISLNDYRKKSSEICHRKLGFEGPTNLFLKQASKSLIQLCMCLHISHMAAAVICIYLEM